MMVCSGCMTHRYCSESCQLKAWPDHKTNCKIIAENNKLVMTSSSESNINNNNNNKEKTTTEATAAKLAKLKLKINNKDKSVATKTTADGGEPPL